MWYSLSCLTPSPWEILIGIVARSAGISLMAGTENQYQGDLFSFNQLCLPIMPSCHSLKGICHRFTIDLMDSVFCICKGEKCICNSHFFQLLDGDGDMRRYTHPESTQSQPIGCDNPNYDPVLVGGKWIWQWAFVLFSGSLEDGREQRNTQHGYLESATLRSEISMSIVTDVTRYQNGVRL